MSNYLKSQLKNFAVNEVGTLALGAAFATLGTCVCVCVCVCVSRYIS